MTADKFANALASLQGVIAQTGLNFDTYCLEGGVTFDVESFGYNMQVTLYTDGDIAVRARKPNICDNQMNVKQLNNALIKISAYLQCFGNMGYE